MTEDDVLAFVRACVVGNRILWTYHANMRLRSRNASRKQVTATTGSYRLIEYREPSPPSHYLPGALVYAEHLGQVFHILFALDSDGGHVRVVTVYRPDRDRWDDDLMRRRRP